MPASTDIRRGKDDCASETYRISEGYEKPLASRSFHHEGQNLTPGPVRDVANGWILALPKVARERQGSTLSGHASGHSSRSHATADVKSVVRGFAPERQPAPRGCGR